jgi:DHA3 family multidrug efflux protein-like MFS transporter
MALMPVVEAAEQTVIQAAVPYEKQGRVFGFASTFEAATAPVTALLIAPIAQVWIIPYLRTDAGRRQWEWLLGAGDSRGIALIMVFTGLLCVLLSLGALLSPQYRLLTRQYATASSADREGRAAEQEKIGRDLAAPLRRDELEWLDADGD